MSSKFRLLITTDTSSEVWSYVTKLCESLLLYMKADILLVCFGDKLDKFQEKEIKRLNLNVLYNECYPDVLNQNAMKEANYYLLKAISEFNPHILHLNHYISISDRVECPVIVTSHEDLISLSKWTKLHIVKNIDQYKKSVMNALDSADTVITTSRSAVEGLFKEYNLKNKFKVIYNGINIEPTGILPENPSILAEGNTYNKSKNLILLSKVADKIPHSIKIRVLGFNNFNKGSKRIEWLGNPSFEDKLEIYRQSSIFLALSTYEQSGLASIISAYSNCAILANDIPIYNELWGDCACIFERNNLNSFIRNLNNLIENKQLLSFTAKNCQAKALSAFHIKRMGLEYFNLYRNILQRNLSAIARENSNLNKI